jgi:CheY-like chemotaxis protein
MEHIPVDDPEEARRLAAEWFESRGVRVVRTEKVESA